MEAHQHSQGQQVLCASQRISAARAFSREPNEKLEYIPCQTEMQLNLKFQYVNLANRLRVKR